jgi:hypothetical protein
VPGAPAAFLHGRHFEGSFHPMDRFYNEQNIARYRALAREAVSEAERTRLLGLLRKEMAKFTELHKARTPRPH